MGAPLVDHSGKTFGKLTPISYDRSTKKWVCKCDCGNDVAFSAPCLVRGFSTSCGCSRKGHGHSPRGKKSSEYYSWYSMVARCRYKSHKAHANYVDRGISVCERWLSFKNFLEDMGFKPGVGFSIDRINNDGNYEPGNCRWATPLEQASNKRPRKKRQIKSLDQGISA